MAYTLPTGEILPKTVSTPPSSATPSNNQPMITTNGGGEGCLPAQQCPRGGGRRRGQRGLVQSGQPGMCTGGSCRTWINPTSASQQKPNNAQQQNTTSLPNKAQQCKSSSSAPGTARAPWGS
ncbi:MAG: hypothetical protein GY755_25245 [Chloroflexi bacterium]|nr:hypothetical protein [Chloroflexota bacterium]